MKFIEEFDGGTAFPTSDKSAAANVIIGDGAPFILVLFKIIGRKNTERTNTTYKFWSNRYELW
jgi:hypothetical protein